MSKVVNLKGTKGKFGTKGTSGNPAGRPPDKLKGLTPLELKQAQSVLKKLLPDSAKCLEEYFKSETGLAKAKAAKEIFTVFMALDNHMVRRAAELQKLLAEIDKGNDDNDLSEADDMLKEESSEGAVVFSTSMINNTP